MKFKALIKFQPYFYVFVGDKHSQEVETILRRKYKDVLADIVNVEVEDLDMVLSLSLIFLSFFNFCSLIIWRRKTST